MFNFTKPKCLPVENFNEINVFGLPAFTQCPPRNWTEAQNRSVLDPFCSLPRTGTHSHTSYRLYYVSLNYRKLPLGFDFFDLSVVFNRTYARNLTLIAPMDTGRWYNQGCAKKSPNSTLNCTGWDGNVVRQPTNNPTTCTRIPSRLLVLCCNYTVFFARLNIDQYFPLAILLLLLLLYVRARWPT